MITAADRVQARWDALRLDEGLVTQVAVLDWISPQIRQDFDCPTTGPHDFLPRTTSRDNQYEFCRNCNRIKREVDPWRSTHGLYGITPGGHVVSALWPSSVP